MSAAIAALAQTNVLVALSAAVLAVDRIIESCTFST